MRVVLPIAPRSRLHVLSSLQLHLSPSPPIRVKLCSCPVTPETAAFPQQQTLMRHLCGLNNGFRSAWRQNSSLASSPTCTNKPARSHTHTHTGGPVPIIKIYVSLLIFHSLSSQLQHDTMGRDLHLSSGPGMLTPSSG